MLEKIDNSFIHEQIGIHIFFHDRVIERWKREIEFDIVSGSFNDYQSKTAAKEVIRHKKDNLFVIFDDITWNCEDKACRLHVYVYDANFFLLRFRLQLVWLSKDVTSKKYAIDANNSCGLSSECQFRTITIHCIKGWFDIIDSMYEFDK